jgi:hypothetical protein
VRVHPDDPIFIAADWIRRGLSTRMTRGSSAEMRATISRVASVEPPSTTKISMRSAGYRWERTHRSVDSI